jgi:hypothetical protein
MQVHLQPAGASMNQKDSAKAKGGLARAEKLTQDQRSEIASLAAQARWNRIKDREPFPKAEHRGVLVIGDMNIPCAVLGTGQRVLTENGVTNALLGSRSGASKRQKRKLEAEGAPMPMFLAPGNIKPFISNELMNGPLTPIIYRDGKRVVEGFDATLLPMICEVWLKAREAGALQPRQRDKAQKAEILMRGLANVGIIALVDEATGYQRDRAKDALVKILEAFIAKELQPWVQTFPGSYYQELFRLRGLKYPADSVKRPQYFGVLTNDIVYKRLAPGVLEELKRVTPKNDSGRPKHKLFQRLTNNVGYPKLREHLGSVVAIMKLSDNYLDFREKIDRIHPRYEDQMHLPFGDYKNDEDDGRGL